MMSRIFSKKNNKYSFLSVNDNSSEFEIDKWTASKFIVEKILPISGYSPYPLDELLLMVGTVCRFKPTHIFEWGTHIGKSARIFYETIIYFGVDAQIYSFDLPDDVQHAEHPHEQRGMLVKGLNRVNLYQEDGLVKSFQLFHTSALTDKRALFYVDGDHSYETVHRELQAILNTIPNAVILLHDTLYQSDDSGYNVGPHRAITDVLASIATPYKRIEVNLGLPGMTLIYNK